MKYKLLHYAEISIFIFAILGFITLFYLKTHQSNATQINQINLPEENIVYAGNLTSDKVLYAVVDPLCPYCALEFFQLKKLHNYKIVYILFPLASHKYSKDLASAVLCKSNNLQRLELLHKIFTHQAFIDDIKEIAKQKCKKGTLLVNQNINYIKSLGITLVPTVILPDGKIITGYRDDLVKFLGKNLDKY